MDKRRWRARAAEERRALTPDGSLDSAAHCRHLARFLADHVEASLRVVLFDAMPGEVDLSGLIDGHPDPDQRFAITRTPESGHTLTVHPYGCPMERHRYGYRQPVADAPTVADEAIGAVLVPALAFDRAGVRLGRGKGYYDRFLARLPAGTAFVGITGGYVVESLPAESFDIPMTHLAGPSGVTPISG